MDNIIDKNIDHDMTCMQTIILMFDSGSHVWAEKILFTSNSTNRIRDVVKETYQRHTIEVPISCKH